jgi:hypothetical protein
MVCSLPSKNLRKVSRTLAAGHFCSSAMVTAVSMVVVRGWRDAGQFLAGVVEKLLAREKDAEGEVRGAGAWATMDSRDPGVQFA